MTNPINPLTPYPTSYDKLQLFHSILQHRPDSRPNQQRMLL
jgi:hypothetical protein